MFVIVLNSADKIQKGIAEVIMAVVWYKIKDKLNILKKLSKKFITLSIKNSFHTIQVDVFLDPFKVRREINMISVAKKSISNDGAIKTQTFLATGWLEKTLSFESYMRLPWTDY